MSIFAVSVRYAGKAIERIFSSSCLFSLFANDDVQQVKVFLGEGLKLAISDIFDATVPYPHSRKQREVLKAYIRQSDERDVYTVHLHLMITTRNGSDKILFDDKVTLNTSWALVELSKTTERVCIKNMQNSEWLSSAFVSALNVRRFFLLLKYKKLKSDNE